MTNSDKIQATISAIIPDLEVHMSEDEIRRRKEWLELDYVDADNMKALEKIVSAHIEELMDYLYNHFLSYEDTKSFFPDEETLKRARSGQKRYFLKLTCGKYDEEYVQDRLRVGAAHYRVGLDTRWYMGAYYRALTFIRKTVHKKMRDDPERAQEMLGSLIKLIFFDMGLAIDMYNSLKMQALREHKDVISQLDTERKVTKSILENAPIGIVRLSTDFVCMEANQEFVVMTGKDSVGQLVGRSIFDVCPSMPEEDFKAAAQTGTSRRANAEALVLSDDEQENYFDWALWPVKEEDASVSGLVATFAHVTAAVKLQQQREDFVATLTHDLKTPILAANRALKLLMEGDFGPIQESQRSIIETILESNDAMYQMVLTLLDVYKYDSGVKQLHMAPVDLVSKVEQMLGEFKTLAEHKKIEIKFTPSEKPSLVLCDIEEIRRVLQNLIDNSLKYTPGGGSIDVIIEQTADTTTVTVKDTGKGISDEDLPKLFQRFWQAASGGRYYASTGLGLYLCRKIVESHDGRIWCESKLGKGSSFSFTLPNVSLDELE